MKTKSPKIQSGPMRYFPDIGVQPPCVPELIRRRAYEFYERRGRQPSHELDDWLQAECEVKHHLGLSNFESTLTPP
jgi:hypothetical protein